VNEKPEPGDQLARECFVPGTGRVYVKTWGCAHNSSDSEYMAGQLAAEVMVSSIEYRLQCFFGSGTIWIHIKFTSRILICILNAQSHPDIGGNI
jgi:hypothetical protein